MFCTRIDVLFGTSQNKWVSTIIKIKALDQFRDAPKMAAGSKTENKFVIIFN
jgi:hypothetical protein